MAIDNLTCLEELNTKSNSLSKRDVASMSSLPRLRRLNLSDTYLGPSDLQPIRKLKCLEMLDISSCDLSEDADLRAVESLSNLKVLRMDDCKLKPGALKLIVGLQSLEALSVRKNSLNDDDVPAITSFKALKVLNASLCDLTDENRRSLRKLTNRRRLN